MTAPFDPVLTRQVSTTLSPLYVASLASRLAVRKYTAAGFDLVDHGERYFALRAATLGRPTAETVIATFFNFAPSHVRRYVPRIWDIVEPPAVVDLLLDAVDGLMAEGLVDFEGTPELLELAALLSEAAATAFARPEGRALFAGIGGIPWPDEPRVQVWLGMHALREFRGDGHVAVLTAHGLTGIEALALHGAMGVYPHDSLRDSRGWPEDEWAVAIDGLRARGLIVPDEVVLSDEGKAYRDEIEHQTDVLAAPAFAEIGEDGIKRIAELGPPIVTAVTAAARPPRAPRPTTDES